MITTCPKAVYAKAQKLYGKDVLIIQSPKSTKKYAIYDWKSEKWIHFGHSAYQDYTAHRDPQRRRQFRKRNAKWAKSPKYSPAYMAYHLLW